MKEWGQCVWEKTLDLCMRRFQIYFEIGTTIVILGTSTYGLEIKEKTIQILKFIFKVPSNGTCKNFIKSLCKNVHVSNK